MNPGWMIGLSGIFCVAIAVLSRVWLPYEDTGTTDGALSHLVATGATIIAYALMMGYFALGFAQEDPTKKSETYGGIVSGFYLGFSAILTTMTFVGTYHGLPYKWFWSLQVIQYVLLAVIWVSATKGVAPMAAEREANARVTGYRKEGVLDNLSRLSNAIQTTDIDAAKTLKKAIDNLHDEVKYFPNHASGSEAENIMSELGNWVQRASVVAQNLAGSDQSIEDLTQISQQAKALQGRVANWKRV